MIVRVSPAAMPAGIPATIPTAIPASPAEAPMRTVPAVPAPAIIGISPPAIRAITPVPPQRIAESGESISIKIIDIYVPFPRIQAVYNVPVIRAADADGKTRIAETDDTRSIFVFVGRTVESVHPLTVQSVIGFLVDIERVILLREFIIVGFVTAVILVHVADIALTVSNYYCRIARRNDGCCRCIGLHHYRLPFGSFRLFCLLFLLLLLLGRHIVQIVIYTLRCQRPRKAKSQKR